MAGSHERRLLNDLMNTYNKLERPVNMYKYTKETNEKWPDLNPHKKVPNETQAIVLKFGLTLQQIMDVVSLTFLLINCNCRDDSYKLSSLAIVIVILIHLTTKHKINIASVSLPLKIQ